MKSNFLTILIETNLYSHHYCRWIKHNYKEYLLLNSKLKYFHFFQIICNINYDVIRYQTIFIKAQ